jgi:ATP-binding cassette subfamily B multidrug efflux pump
MARNKFDVDELLDTPFNVRHFKKAGKYIKSNSKLLIKGLFISLFVTSLGLISPYYMKILIDYCIPNKDINLIIIIGLTFVISSIIIEILNIYRIKLITTAGHSIVHEIRCDVFKHLLKLPFSYYDNRPHGKILVRVVHYINNVSDFLSNGLIGIVVECISIIFILVFMMILDIKLTIVILSGLPLFFCFLLLIKN